jgi:hypothetical protein
MESLSSNSAIEKDLEQGSRQTSHTPLQPQPTKPASLKGSEKTLQHEKEVEGEEEDEMVTNTKAAMDVENENQKDLEAGSTSHHNTEKRSVARDPQPSDENDTGLTKLEDGTLVVNWKQPYDPENPKQWSFKRKWAATASECEFRK